MTYACCCTMYMFINIARSNWCKTCIVFIIIIIMLLLLLCISEHFLLSFLNIYFVCLLAWFRWICVCVQRNITKNHNEVQNENQLKQNEKINDHKQKKTECIQRSNERAKTNPFASREWNIAATTNKCIKWNHRICICCIDSWQHWHWQQNIAMSVHLGFLSFSLSFNEIAAWLWLERREWASEQVSEMCVGDVECKRNIHFKQYLM